MGFERLENKTRDFAFPAVNLSVFKRFINECTFLNANLKIIAILWVGIWKEIPLKETGKLSDES